MKFSDINNAYHYNGELYYHTYIHTICTRTCAQTTSRRYPIQSLFIQEKIRAYFVWRHFTNFEIGGLQSLKQIRL